MLDFESNSFFPGVPRVLLWIDNNKCLWLMCKKLLKELVENYVEHAIIMAMGNWAFFYS